MEGEWEGGCHVRQVSAYLLVVVGLQLLETLGGGGAHAHARLRGEHEHTSAHGERERAAWERWRRACGYTSSTSLRSSAERESITRSVTARTCRVRQADRARVG